MKEKEAKCIVCGALATSPKSPRLKHKEIKPKKWCNIHAPYGITKEKMIYRYGNEEGLKRWNIYCEKQRYTNSFEYKHKRYGWVKEQFDEFNKSRAVTIETLTKKYGEEKGKEIFESYREKQKDAGCSLEYFIEKFGKKKGKEEYKRINSQKAITLDNFIRLYGEKEGPINYLKAIDKHHNFYSKISKEFFEKIINKCKETNKLEELGKLYYAETEFSIMDSELKRFFKYDFCSLVKNKIIEFQGIHFHPKSKFDKKFKNPYNKITSKEQWELDRIKEHSAYKRNFKILYIWEDAYKNNPELELEKAYKFLTEE